MSTSRPYKVFRAAEVTDTEVVQEVTVYEYSYLRTKTCEYFLDYFLSKNLYTGPKIRQGSNFGQGYLRDYWELEKNWVSSNIYAIFTFISARQNSIYSKLNRYTAGIPKKSRHKS